MAAWNPLFYFLSCYPKRYILFLSSLALFCPLMTAALFLIRYIISGILLCFRLSQASICPFTIMTIHHDDMSFYSPLLFLNNFYCFFMALELSHIIWNIFTLRRPPWRFPSPRLGLISFTVTSLLNFLTNCRFLFAFLRPKFKFFRLDDCWR